MKIEKLKCLAPAALVSLTLLGIPSHSSQAADTMAVSVIQPDGSKRAMKLNLDQPLSEVRVMLMNRGLNITPNDNFVMEMGDLSPREESQWIVREVLCGNILSFKPRASASQEVFEAVNTPDLLYNLVERVYANSAIYSQGVFQHYKDGVTFSTQPRAPQKLRIQAVLNYNDTLIPERVLKKGIPGQDGRIRIQDTTAWPHSIHTHLGMKIHGNTYMGSGVIVGPHHLLTCAHCVYKFDVGAFFEEIFVYPALNGTVAPFNRIKATKAYLFKAYQDQGDERFDMALLLLDQSIGGYTGWGGLLSASDADLSREVVHITGYPGDKGDGKQMWSMSHTIKTVKPEGFDYEIDTYGGQSGSPVWINKWGMPMVLGVHTLGSDSINSGVRLSSRKFEKIIQVIKDTYVLNSDVSGLDLRNRLALASKPAIFIPPIAQGYEAIYERFLKGTLIYRPIEGVDEGMIKLPIRDLSNPLQGTFNLSGCGDTERYLSISTGYRKGQKPENANKVEIWIAPRFLIEKEVNTTAGHFKPIMGKWKRDKAPLGLFWTWGGWYDLHAYDYLTTQSIDEISNDNLYEKRGAALSYGARPGDGATDNVVVAMRGGGALCTNPTCAHWLYPGVHEPIEHVQMQRMAYTRTSCFSCEF